MIPIDKLRLKNFSLLFTEKCKQLGENEVMLGQMASNLELAQMDKRYVDNEYSTLKQKNEDLNGALNRALEQRDIARSEALDLDMELEALKNDKNEMEARFRGMSLSYLLQSRGIFIDTESFILI